MFSEEDLSKRLADIRSRNKNKLVSTEFEASNKGKEFDVISSTRAKVNTDTSDSGSGRIINQVDSKVLKVDGKHGTFVTATAPAINTNNPSRLDPYIIKLDESNAKIYFSEMQLPYIKDFCDKSLKTIYMQEGSELPGERYYITEVNLNSAKELVRCELYRAEIALCNLEQWYDKMMALKIVRNRTIKTHFIPLDDDDVKSICASYVCCEGEHRLRPEENALLARLANKIVKFMPKNWSEKGYFCKLSTRSPKDSLTIQKKMREWLISENKREEEIVPTDLISKKYSLMRTSSTAEITALIGSSYRVYADLLMWQKYRVPGTANEKMNIVLREWEDIKPEEEFRCFVHLGKLTAISQYYCYKVFPSLQEVSTVLRIKERIAEFFNIVKESIDLPSYIMDVAVTSSSVFAIEINPMRTSGSGLFNWDTDFNLICPTIDNNVNNVDSGPEIRVLSRLIDFNLAQ